MAKLNVWSYLAVLATPPSTGESTAFVVYVQQPHPRTACLPALPARCCHASPQEEPFSRPMVLSSKVRRPGLSCAAWAWQESLSLCLCDNRMTPPRGRMNCTVHPQAHAGLSFSRPSTGRTLVENDQNGLASKTRRFGQMTCPTHEPPGGNLGLTSLTSWGPPGAPGVRLEHEASSCHPPPSFCVVSATSPFYFPRLRFHQRERERALGSLSVEGHQRVRDKGSARLLAESRLQPTA